MANILNRYDSELLVFLLILFRCQCGSEENQQEYQQFTVLGEKTDVSIPQEVNILDLVHVRVATKLSKARPDLDVYLLHPSEVEEYKGKKPEPTPLDSKESHSSVVEEDYQGVD